MRAHSMRSIDEQRLSSTVGLLITEERQHFSSIAKLTLVANIFRRYANGASTVW